VGGSLSFNSQYGLIDVARLPVVSVDGVPQAAPSNQFAQTAPDAVPAPPPVQASTPQPTSTDTSAGMDIFATIDKLADLRSRDILTEAEFQTKKAELLARL
jgi:hypothetical protein